MEIRGEKKAKTKERKKFPDSFWSASKDWEGTVKKKQKKLRVVFILFFKILDNDRLKKTNKKISLITNVKKIVINPWKKTD